MEIKSRPHPITYVIERYVRIAGSFYFRDRTQRASTPDIPCEHCIGYINIVTTCDCWISALLEVEAKAPSKTDSSNNEHTTTPVGQKLRPLDLKCTLRYKNQNAVKTCFSIITRYGAYRSWAMRQVSWHLLPRQVPKTPDPPWLNTENKSERISLAAMARPGFCYFQTNIQTKQK